MDLIAGIDGGGTRTTLCCKDLATGTITQAVFGPFNLNSIGQAAFEALLSELTAWLTTQGTCRALCIGAAGISNPEMKRLIGLAMDRAGISRWSLVGDHEIALAGALQGAPGIALVAGTGSICIGRNQAGETTRAGGWGHLLGDGGSGYGVGRDALAAVTRHWDNPDCPTLLTQMVMDQFGFQVPSDLVPYVYGGDKSRVAAVSRLVETAYHAGDPVAQAIIEKNAQELVWLITTVASKLEISQGEVAMLGGLLQEETAIRQSLITLLTQKAPNLQCVLPRESAALGALRLAQGLLSQ